MKAALASRSSGAVHPALRGRTIVAFGALLSLALTPAGAIAATAPATIGISATVAATCLNTATALAFGVYTGVISTTTATISVTCTNTTTYSVGLGYGLFSGATAVTRRMTGPAGAALGYGMFSDAGYATNWGNTLAENWVTGTATGAAQPLTVYGRAPAGQFVAPGAYADTITATVTY